MADTDNPVTDKENVRGNQVVQQSMLTTDYYLNGDGQDQIDTSLPDDQQERQARKIITKLMRKAIIGINNSATDKDTIQNAVGTNNPLPDYVHSPVTIQGTSLVLFYNDEDDEDHYFDASAGDIVIFDTVLGKGCTGLNPDWGWGPDEYKIVGICMGDYQDEDTEDGIYAPQQDDGGWLMPVKIKQTATANLGPINARLLEPLYGCSSADAIINLLAPDGNGTIDGDMVTIYDPFNMVSGELLAKNDDDGVLVLKAGLCVNAEVFYPNSEKATTPLYQFTKAGVCCGGSNQPGSEGGSQHCWTPASSGWPDPPDETGDWGIIISAGCVKYVPARKCNTGGSSFSGGSGI